MFKLKHISCTFAHTVPGFWFPWVPGRTLNLLTKRTYIPWLCTIRMNCLTEKKRGQAKICRNAHPIFWAFYFFFHVNIMQWHWKRVKIFHWEKIRISIIPLPLRVKERVKVWGQVNIYYFTDPTRFSGPPLFSCENQIFILQLYHEQAWEIKTKIPGKVKRLYIWWA